MIWRQQSFKALQMGKPHRDKLRNSRNPISLFFYFLIVIWDTLTTSQKGLMCCHVCWQQSLCHVGTYESIWHEYYQYSLKCYLTSTWIATLDTVHNHCHKKGMARQVWGWILMQGLIQIFVMQRGIDLVCADLKLSIKLLWSKRFIRKKVNREQDRKISYFLILMKTDGIFPTFESL